MSLQDLQLPTVIDSSTADMAGEFYVPALSVSANYDRGVGFFSSGWLRMVAQGLVAFAANGGRARQRGMTSLVDLSRSIKKENAS